jgi:hypothetical protein
MNELAICLQKQIGESHQRCVDLGKKLEETMQAQMATLQETGILLGKAQQDLSPDDFRELREAIGLDLDTVRNYISFTAAHPEPVKELPAALRCLKKALQATGQLELNPGNASDAPIPVGRNFWSAIAVLVRNFVSNFGDLWRQFQADGRQLSEAEKDQLLGALTPILEIARTLK